MRPLFPALLAALCAGLAAPDAQATDIPTDTAVLGGMDKVTARVRTIEAPVGRTVRFGTLELIVRTCLTRPPEEPPENAAFLDVWEVRPGEPATEVFRGWMFSSSPALSAMEHPVYDVWVLECVDPESETDNTDTGSSGGS